MTSVYFVRHCKPDGRVKDDRQRPLTEEGLSDSLKLLELLKDKEIDVFISSPYRRSYDSIKAAADFYGKKIETDERLRERRSGVGGNNHEMFKKRWADFTFAEDGGESLSVVQKRNIEAVREILEKYEGKNIVVGTHGTALSSIIQYFDKSFDGGSFMEIIDFMPWVLEMQFQGDKLILKKDLFHIKKEYKG